MKRPGVQTWWDRPCGVREVLQLALPLVAATLSWTVMNFTDRMFLLWHSTAAMAAALPAGMLYFTVLCLPLGVVSYVNTFVAQYHGARRSERIGLIVWQGLWICLLSLPLLCATIPLAPLVFSLAGHDPEVARLEITYYQVLVLGSGGVLISATLSAFFTGRGYTKVVMLVDTGGALLNGLLDYALIFGHWGFPELGIAGAAWATTIALWSQALVYWWIMHRRVHWETCRLAAGRRYDAALLRRLWRYGGPNGLQLLTDVAAFTIFILFVGRLGEEALAATNLAFNINSLAFVPTLGVGLAATTLVGQQLGQQRPDLAARATWTALLLAEVYTGLIAMFYLFTPDWFLQGHALGTSPEQFAGLRDLTVVLLRFVALYAMFDAMTVVFVGAIKGAGDMQFVLRSTLLLAPLPVLVACLGVSYWGRGIIWCWITITAWACTAGVVYCARFLQGRWRQMRVIEPDVALEDSLAAADLADEYVTSEGSGAEPEFQQWR